MGETRHGYVLVVGEAWAMACRREKAGRGWRVGGGELLESDGFGMVWYGLVGSAYLVDRGCSWAEPRLWVGLLDATSPVARDGTRRHLRALKLEKQGDGRGDGGRAGLVQLAWRW